MGIPRTAGPFGLGESRLCGRTARTGCASQDPGLSTLVRAHQGSEVRLNSDLDSKAATAQSSDTESEEPEYAT